MMDNERHGQSTDKPLMRRLLRMMSSVGLYTDKFESPFLQESQRYSLYQFLCFFYLVPDTITSHTSHHRRRFFYAEGQQLLDVVDTAGFLLQVERRLQQAAEMVASYLDISTRTPLGFISVYYN